MSENKKVKKEKYNKYEKKIEAVLDLHQKTQTEALRELESFLQESLHSNRKYVQIITGKGLNNPEKKSILRPLVAVYLSEKNITFETSKFTQGGAGAWIINIEKSKDYISL